ncbi:alpha/beta hydrolase [Streptomyces jumonjinensis]|uniref:Alpha/beta hydrolase n=1 Tax=Streptomyces jumonjinensis TaxID=1945 RepID=A0A646KI40_STRJU|nr:alpha/beta hydrolase [Streptomyces jumonjinensis]MQT01731.1 alpha/beta hydrolase [Streptomyces jumonjinensis]
MQRRRYAPLIAVSVLATLAPGLAAAAPAAAAPEAPARAAGPLDSYAQQKLSWKRCDINLAASLRCATVKVPLDYGEPRGKTLDVEISRIKTSLPGQRRGVLFSNPGGPGGAGLDLPLELRKYLPVPVQAKYDLIGFDPRGIGRSSPVECGLNKQDQKWPRQYRDKTFAGDVAWAKGVAGKCRANVGERLSHITTRNTARDMDVIRAVLGEKKISYFGGSYGTYLGAVYTQMFPQRSDRFVLDSAVDPKLAWRGTFQLWGSDAERAFKRWTENTARRNAEFGLGDTPAAVSRTFWDIIRQADRKPITIGDTPFTGAEIRDLMRAQFFTVQNAAEAVVMLRDAAAGKPTPEIPHGEENDNFFSSFWSIICGDTRTWSKDPQTYREESIRDRAKYPLYGDFASNITPCASWDKAVEPATAVDNRVPSLIVQNEWDSQTPLSTAEGMHRALKGSRLVTVDEGEGHGVYGFNECADGVTDAYLLTGKLPAGNVTCGVTPADASARSAEPRSFPVTPLPPALRARF